MMLFTPHIEKVIIMIEEIQSYKPYARIVTVLSAIIIILASLDASQVINLFPQYANQINTIIMIAGLLAPAIAQEKRVVRAEEKKEQEIISNIDTVADPEVPVDEDGI